jgi:hypothetical protein
MQAESRIEPAPPEYPSVSHVDGVRLKPGLSRVIDPASFNAQPIIFTKSYCLRGPGSKFMLWVMIGRDAGGRNERLYECVPATLRLLPLHHLH